MINFNDFNNYTIKSYTKGDIIKIEGDICESVGLIIEGKISIYNSTYLGDTFIISTLNEYDFFGDNLVFSENNTYPGNIVSITNTKICFIKQKDFLNSLSNNIILLNEYLKYSSKKFILMQERMKVISQPSLSNKILYYIDIQSKKTKSNYILINSISDLAIYLNVTRPSLSRELNKLIKNNYIIKIKKQYKLKKPL